MKKLLLLFIFSLVALNVEGATWYIRTDGGTNAECDGTHDAAQSGATDSGDAGSVPDCALNHPNWVFPPRGEDVSTKAAASDTVVIKSGSYRVGCQNLTDCKDATVNLTNNSYCDDFYAYDCYMSDGSASAVGLPDNITVIGCSSTGCGCSTDGDYTTTCSTARPILWGAGRVNQVLNMSNTDGFLIQDIVIEDHDSCGEGHETITCSASGDLRYTELSMKDGINIEGAGRTTEGTFKNVIVQGAIRYGIYGGNVGDIVFDNTWIIFNSFGGWNLDTCSNDGTCGVDSGYRIWVKNNSRFDWNGCVDNGTVTPGTTVASGCYGQGNGGYGDAIGSSNTSGEWLFEDSSASWNTQDGPDLLYINRGSQSGGTITIKRGRFEGNSGDQLKGDNNIYVEDTNVIDNCNFFKGKSYSDDGFDICRGGYAITIANNDNSGSTVAKFYNNTITCNHDTMFGAGVEGTCTGNFNIEAKNSLLLGGVDYIGGGIDNCSIFYKDCSATVNFTEAYNTCSDNFKEATPCPAASSFQNVASSDTYSGTIKQGTGTTLATYYQDEDYLAQLSLKSTSTARDAADESLAGDDADDYYGNDRGASWDQGALEYGSTPSGGGGEPAGAVRRISGALRINGGLRL